MEARGDWAPSWCALSRGCCYNLGHSSSGAWAKASTRNYCRREVQNICWLSQEFLHYARDLKGQKKSIPAANLGALHINLSVCQKLDLSSPLFSLSHQCILMHGKKILPFTLQFSNFPNRLWGWIWSKAFWNQHWMISFSLLLFCGPSWWHSTDLWGEILDKSKGRERICPSFPTL